jgi:hypothetical protein
LVWLPPRAESPAGSAALQRAGSKSQVDNDRRVRANALEQNGGGERWTAKGEKERRKRKCKAKEVCTLLAAGSCCDWEGGAAANTTGQQDLMWSSGPGLHVWGSVCSKRWMGMVPRVGLAASAQRPSRPDLSPSSIHCLPKHVDIRHSSRSLEIPGIRYICWSQIRST